jgi:hypothetical protein
MRVKFIVLNLYGILKINLFLVHHLSRLAKIGNNLLIHGTHMAAPKGRRVQYVSVIVFLFFFTSNVHARHARVSQVFIK